MSGEIESITDTHTLWIRGDDLTIPVSLESGSSQLYKTKCFLLPKYEGEGEPQAPEQIRWNRVSTLSEGVKVFTGGQIKSQNDRLSFYSTKEKPLTVIFYSCPDDELAGDIIRAARTRSEYWNNITPISIAIGALTLIYIAASFLGRPAYFFTLISAFTAVFIPVLPFLPPGVLFTTLCRRLILNSRKLRVKRDISRLNQSDRLGGSFDNQAKRYTIIANAQETAAAVLVVLGISINIIFIFLILNLFGIVSW